MSEAHPVEFADYAPDQSAFQAEVLEGLTRPQKRIPCKYLYDANGSRLFEEICDSREYYPTRTELAIMEAHAAQMAQRLGPECLLVEYGSGSSRKTRLLLDRMERPAAYVPIDISRAALERSTAALALGYPALEILPVCADYANSFRIPDCRQAVRRRAVYFPGSTIGNFSPQEARRFLRRVRRLVGPDGAFLGGIDLKKDPEILEAAYNDRAGITARFNLNLLVRVNRELGADFALENFRHHAFYNRPFGRIEMHLVSEVDQTARVADREISLKAGETIHTESSYKYDPADFAALAGEAGFAVGQAWSDPGGLFSVQYVTPG